MSRNLNTDNNHATGADPVSDVLENFRMRGAVFFVWEPGWPFATGVADGKAIAQQMFPHNDNVISYHIVTEGSCWGGVAGEEPVQLNTGDILVLPGGDHYMISDQPRLPEDDDLEQSLLFFKMLRSGEIPPVIRNGGEGPGRSKLICGFLSCDLQPFNPLLSALPKVLRIPADNKMDDLLTPLIQFALSETQKSQGGERCLLMRLGETLFIEVIRRYLRNTNHNLPGWISGLRDPMVGKSLAVLHARYEEPWTLEKLAGEVGISRSILIDRFGKTVGVTPITYLTQWRMQIAANLLCDSADKIFSIAQQVGYDSEAAFSRAFKRVVGVSPSLWRKNKFRNVR